MTPGPIVLPLTRDGRIADAAALELFEQQAQAATDCFVFCHGWLYDEAEARREGRRFFALLDGALAPLRDRVRPLHVILHWPSKPFADGSDDRAIYARAEAISALADLCGAEVPSSPEEEAELDGLLARLGTPPGRGLTLLSPLEALSFWMMKRRAGQVGERFGREHLAGVTGQVRAHLIGHSFGGKLLTSAVLGGARPASLTLLLAAFSAFAFAGDVPGFGTPGLYHDLLTRRRVTGPIAVLRSEHDAALSVLYPCVTSSAQVDRTTARKSRILDMVATTAIGAVGARGVGAPELTLLDTQQIGLPTWPVVNIDGSAIVRATEPLVGAHRDIFHREVANLVLLAAGLLTGGPEALRPVRLTPAIAGR
jgi:hypothetical protein